MSPPRRRRRTRTRTRNLNNVVVLTNKCPKCHIQNRAILVKKSETGKHGKNPFIDSKGRSHIHSKQLIYEHYKCGLCWHIWAIRKRNSCNLCGWIQKE